MAVAGGLVLQELCEQLRLPSHHVRFTPKSRQIADISECLLCAKSGHMQRNKQRAYSITSSARASSVGGTSRPSVFAAFRLITSSYLVGACTGSSLGFSPRRMRSTYEATR